MEIIIYGDEFREDKVYEKIKELKEIVEKSESIVFFGGAGVSTESGIPDFRSVDGLYNQQYDYPPEIILSHTFFQTNTEEFFRFYRNKMLFPKPIPNKAHYALSKLEGTGKLRAVVTQNIDGLHQAAGSKNVFELHGSVHRNYCAKCHKFYDLEYIISTDGIPRCECGGVIKPDVVLYEEALDQDTIQGSVDAISLADTLIVGGTSLAVYPAAGFLDYFKGNKLIIINKSSTFKDKGADIVINEAIGEVLSQAVDI